MPIHGNWKKTLVSAQTPVLLCSNWEDLPLVVVGHPTAARLGPGPNGETLWRSHFHVGFWGIVCESGKFLMIFLSPSKKKRN